MNYDAWLEKPYQDRYAQDDLVEQYEDEYREANDLDDDDEVTYDDILDYLEDLREDYEVEAAERERDYALEMEYEDRY